MQTQLVIRKLSNLEVFASGDKLFAFFRGFYGLNGLKKFFTKQMSIF